ncbi:MAG: hypothetical protein ABIT08_03130 [Bacteroidia bacterium]
MKSTFILNADELNGDFTRAVKALFKGRKVSITVKTEMDETEYLLSTKANKQHLRESLIQYKKGNFKKVKI